MWVYFGELCVYLCQYCTVWTTMVLEHSLKSGGIIPPALLFFLKIALAFWSSFWFHTYFRIICSNSIKNDIGILIGIVFKL